MIPVSKLRATSAAHAEGRTIKTPTWPGILSDTLIIPRFEGSPYVPRGAGCVLPYFWYTPIFYGHSLPGQMTNPPPVL